MKIQIEKLTEEQLTQELINKKVDINLINPLKATQKKAFFEAVKLRPNLLTLITEENLLTSAIKTKPELFVYLEKHQYTDNLAQLFLAIRFAPNTDKRAVSESTKTHKLSMQKSLDEKLVFNYAYVSPDDDELYYLDSELRVPASIRSSIKVTMKLVSAISLIEKLDTHITELGENRIVTVINDIISNQYKAFLYNYINEHKVGYYTLCTSLEQIQTGLIEKLNSVFFSYGIVITDFIIKKIAIPKDIQHKVEDLSFEIRQRKAQLEANEEFAKKSLENYETKLSIENKYPNGEHSLTEYEKDLALKRYLVKTGKFGEETIDHSIAITQKLDKTDAQIAKVDDFEPETPNATSMSFKGKFTLWAILCAIFTIIMFATAGAGTGLIFLSVFTALFGMVGALNSKKFSEQPKNGNDDNEGDVK